MYKDYYHLQTDPFSTHPNTDTFFISETHREAWYYLLFGIDTQEPFLLLTGEYGMGKTLLCLRLIKALKEKGIPRVEYIPTCNEGYGGILRRMAASLGISTTPEDEEILQDMIYDRFRADTENSRFYLIIDDAHELDPTILTKLKYLSTFNHDEFFPVIMIFVGHPSFLQGLRTPALSSLNQRIKRRCHLARFSFDDTKNYIYFRLLKSGASGIPAFPEETIQKIFEYSGGVPRLINNISDTCLLIGASKKLISIPPEIVDYAKNLIDGSLPETKTEAIPDEGPSGNTRHPILFSEDLPETNAVGSSPIFLSQDAAPRAVKTPPVTFSDDFPAGNSVRIQRKPIFSTTDEDEEYIEETSPRKVSIHGKRTLRKVLTLAVLVILLILAFSWLYDFFTHDNKIISFLTPKPPQGSLQSENTSNVLEPQPERNTTGAPILREEMTGKSPSEPFDSTSRIGAMPSSSDTAQGNMVIPKENVSAEKHEMFPFHPFSLRSSSYQKHERAFSEISEMRKMGLTPYLVKVDLGDLGTLWRIYIGFYSTEEEARKIKNTYKLVNATVQKTEYACQVGEFTNETDGMSMFERFKQSGYFPYAIQKGRNLFRMYLGAYEKRTEAEALQHELQTKGVKSQVVKR